MFSSPINKVDLVRFSVGNYRSFKEDVVIDLAPLNLIFGGNSSGKSRLLRFLPYLMKCIATSDFTNGNTLEDILSHVFGKERGDHIRFSYDLIIHHSPGIIGGDDDDYDDILTRYRVTVELTLINDQNPFNPKLWNYRDPRWSLIEKSAKILLVENDTTLLVYDSKADIEFIEVEQVEFESEFGMYDISYTNQVHWMHPLLRSYLEKILMSDSKSTHRLRGRDPNLSNIYLNYLESDEPTEFKYNAKEDYIFDMDSKTLPPYPGLAIMLSKWRSMYSKETFGASIDLMSYWNRRIKGPKGSGQFRRDWKEQERIQNIMKAQSKALHFLTKDFINYLNIDYLAGIRNLPTYAGTSHELIGLPKKMADNYYRVDEAEFLNEDEIPSEDDLIKTVNEFLGPNHLNVQYAIVKSSLLKDKMVLDLSDLLQVQGVSATQLLNYIESNGFWERFQLQDLANGTLVNTDEVGLGMTQVLPIVGRLAVAQDALLIFEQPELHLHPGMQTGLAKLIVHSAKTRGNRFLIETHSEHLIKAIQLEVARHTSTGGQDGLSRDDINVLYTRRDPERKSSTIRTIELDSFGSFTEPWPDDFFDAAADLTMERLRMMNRN